MVQLTIEQAESFAPDSGTLDRARKIAKASRYQGLGSDQRAIWGTALGSSSYRMMVDLHGPAFRCSCPVNKLPCKHIMGMLLLVSSDASVLGSEPPPEEVGQWLAKRDAAAQAKAGREAGEVKDPQAQVRRAAKREANVEQGIEELRLFLEDTLTLGLAESCKRTQDVWERVRRRLVDAQAGRLAGQLESLRLQMGQGPVWAEDAVERIAQLNLLITAYRQRERLSAEQQDTLRTRIGWPRSQPLGFEAESDWIVLNSRRRYESGLHSQMVWLVGRTQRRFAYLLHFAKGFGTATLPGGYVAGRALRGRIGFHSAWNPLRAELESDNLLLHDGVADWPWLEAWADDGFASAIREVQQQRIRYPFREPWPLLVSGVRLVMKAGRLALADRNDVVMALDGSFPARNQLLRLLGRGTATLFLTCTDSRALLPWGGIFEGRWHGLNLDDGGAE